MPTPLGDVGETPPQAENSVASVAPEATWQALRRTGVVRRVCVRVRACRSDMAMPG